MVPFRVVQKQESRHPYHPRASLLRRVDVIAYENTYSIHYGRSFTVNNIRTGLPFQDENGVRATQIGTYIHVTTSFGLRVEYDGDYMGFYYLCDSYAGFVCGLCGNADGNARNDFVDRNGNIMNTNGDYFTRFFQWGSAWRVGKDTTIDQDGKP